jgi:hypothetical protein
VFGLLAEIFGPVREGIVECRMLLATDRWLHTPTSRTTEILCHVRLLFAQRRAESLSG